MSAEVTFTIDGKTVTAKPGETVMQAADRAGIYIPRLCAHKDLSPMGRCRVCTVFINGRSQASCTEPVTEGIVVENDTERVLKIRKDIVEMLLVEGNHFCPVCERSGNCELQAVAYRLGVDSPHYPQMFPSREIDFSHKDIYIDHNRCILCRRCERASKELDGKNVFQFIGRGVEKKVGINAEKNLADTNIDALDKAIEYCPVGALVRKRIGYVTPVGQRKYDQTPIGLEIEKNNA